MEIEVIQNKIFEIRGCKVMLDFDLASLYNVENKRLKASVRRNINRFPEDFMFELTEIEFTNLRTKFSSSSYGGLRYMPFAFTEQGIAMLSSVLNSEKAIEVNISIIRAFVTFRQFSLTYNELKDRIAAIESQFPDIYKALNYLVDKDAISKNNEERNKIGYKK
ncbi:MAG: ORF6N domain-containing protein [Flavobacterium sp.]|nr:ORF6N domain-containing protein [Flavobacterium sp.]MBP6587572.1 ORF6N domain-containing protein [Flavobacterium sp.]MBP7470016.1 ORF6N domain-containing protein [Flavobacterium sp.]